MVEVIDSAPGSAVCVSGIRTGDMILRINGEEIEDFLDFHFNSADEFLEIELISAADGKLRHLTIEREPGVSLGLGVSEGPIRRCANKCVFCFVDQLPKRLRKSLYVKDEDYRYSFLLGNYITGTSLRGRHIERIVEMGLSPLYISVHATDPDIRAMLLGCKPGGKSDIMPLLSRLTGNGISLHLQAVVCPGINDGPVLERTARDLESLGSEALSFAVVPVGLTAHRRGLAALKPFDRHSAAAALKLVQELQGEFLKGRSSRFIHAADELFLRAGARIPAAGSYEGYPQIENGVGMVRAELDSMKKVLRRKNMPGFLAGKSLLMITGTAFGPLLENRIAPAVAKVTGARITVVKVINDLLGDSVNVAGLLPGKSIIEKIKSVSGKFDYIILPAEALNENDLFIDDVSLDEIRKSCTSSGVIAAVNPSDAIEIIKEELK